MKIPFDIKYRPQIESGEYKLYCHGCNIKIVCWDADEYLPLVVIINGTAHQLTVDCVDERNTKFDLFIIIPEPELTEFEQSVRDMIVKELTTKFDNKDSRITATVSLDDKTAHRLSLGLLELAKKEICKGCTTNMDGFIKGRTAAEKDYQQGYMDGYKDAEKRDNESVAYHYPTYGPPCFYGGVCINPFKDCINCPNHTSGTTINTTSCKKED